MREYKENLFFEDIFDKTIELIWFGKIKKVHVDVITNDKCILSGNDMYDLMMDLVADIAKQGTQYTLSYNNDVPDAIIKIIN